MGSSDFAIDKEVARATRQIYKVSMKFEQLQPRDRSEIDAALSSENPERITPALITVALHDPDQCYVEEIILRFLNHTDPFVRGVAATAAGHVARIHKGFISTELLPRLKALLDDPAMGGKAREALDDVQIFGRP